MKTVQQWKREFPAAFNWWHSLSNEDQAAQIYYFCTSNEISPLEFEMQDIVTCYNIHINQPV